MSRVDVCSFRRTQAGFSLLELLAVLAILALIAGVVIVRTGNTGGQAEVKSAVANAVNLVRDVRTEAIASSSEQVLLIDTQRRRLSHGTHGKWLKLDDGLELQVRVAESENYGQGLAGVRFFSNGSSTGGTLTFRGQGGINEVRINWLTGRVSVAEGL